jgi:hypothetical protein
MSAWAGRVGSPQPPLNFGALGWLWVKSCGRSSPLHVDEDAWSFRHGGVSDVFHHQRKAGARSHGEGFRSAPDRALQADGGGELIFHLDERPAHGRDSRCEALDNFGRGRDRVSGRKACTRCQCAFAAGVITVNEMDARKDARWISLHSFFLRPWRAAEACVHKSQNRGSTFRTSRNHCTSLVPLHGVDDSPWS